MGKGRWRWRRVSGEIRMWDRNGEGKMKWRKVSGEIRMGDRVSGKIRMEDRWVGYKRRKKWAWEGILFLERKFWMFERILGDWRKTWEEENTKKERENFEDDESLKLGIIITNSFIDQHKSRVHPRQRTNKFELSVFIYSFICGFSRKLAQIVYTFSLSLFSSYFYVREEQFHINGKAHRGAKLAQTSS